MILWEGLTPNHPPYCDSENSDLVWELRIESRESRTPPRSADSSIPLLTSFSQGHLVFFRIRSSARACDVTWEELEQERSIVVEDRMIKTQPTIAVLGKKVPANKTEASL